MKELRNGFTTGSAMTAAAVAAYRKRGGNVELLLPGGGLLDIPAVRLFPGGAAVLKDGGDDPDVTTGSEIVVTMEHFDGESDESDYTLPCGCGELIVRGGAGVGRATRPGLAIPVGKAAINPGPRRMLAENLVRAGFGREPGERLLLTVRVPGGEEIAKKTLNPTLGVVGGISILGNSGIVRPYSNAAYAATVALQLRSVAAGGGRQAALVTGNRSAEAIARDFPELSEQEVIRIGDFIAVAVRAAAGAGLKRLIVGTMAGKLFKYACGEENTHAHCCKLNLAKLREFGAELSGVVPENFETMGELSCHVDEACYRKLLDLVYEKALAVLQGWAGEACRVEVKLYDDAGRVIR